MSSVCNNNGTLPRKKENRVNHDEFVRLYQAGYNLFPTHLKTSFPSLGIDWKIYQTERVAERVFQEWLSRYPQYNFALITGFGNPALVVVDADDDAAIEFVESHCPQTLEVRTGSGGKHYYYRHPGVVVKNRQGTTLDGKRYKIDIRGDGGIVLCPGCYNSTHQTNYHRIDNWSVSDLANVPIYSPDWLPCPNWDREGSVEPEEDHSEAIDKITLPIEERIKQARHYLSHCPGSTEGKGASDYCFALANCLVWGFALPADDATRVLYDWGQRDSNLDRTRAYKPWSWKEISHKVRDACSKEYEGTFGDKVLPRQNRLDHSVFVLPPLKKTASEPSTQKRWFTMQELRERRKESPPSWLIQDHLIEGGMGFLLAESGTGKTFLAIDIASCIATGKPFLGRFQVMKKPVVYVGMEGCEDFDLRQEAWEQQHGLSVGNNLIQIQEDFNLTSVKEANELIGIVDSIGMPEIGLVIFDTFFNMLAGEDENSGAAVGSILRAQKMIQRKFKCGILNIHHPGHENKARPRGHSSMKPAANCFLLVEGQLDNSLKISCTKQKNGRKFQSYHVNFDMKVPTSSCDEVGNSLTFPVAKDLEDSWDGKLIALGPNPTKLFRAICHRHQTRTFRYKDFKEVALSLEIATSTAKRAFESLQNQRLILKDSIKYRVNPAAASTLNYPLLMGKKQ